MPIKESLHFSYDGINSQDMGIINVSVNTGLFEESLVGSRVLVENSIEGRSEPYFKYVDYEPLEIPVSFAFQEKYDKQKMKDVMKWLLQDKYKPLIFSENEEKIYYAVLINDFTHIHNGLQEGYLNLTFRCNTFHAYSPTYQSEFYTINSSGVIEVPNDGDLKTKPKMYIRKINSGGLFIKNLSNNGEVFSLYGLNDGEEVTVDHYYREIKSSQERLLYGDSNKRYISLVTGINQIEITGSCEIVWETRYRLL